MPRVGFEPMIPVFTRAKTVHDLGRAATVIGRSVYKWSINAVTASNPVYCHTLNRHNMNNDSGKSEYIRKLTLDEAQ
jgi:hypothetical protein